MKYYVYLLKSINYNRYYIGQTDNIQNRLKLHNQGRVKSTAPYKPWKLVGYEEYETRNKARYREYQLKKSAWQRKKFISKLEKNDNVQ